MKEVNATYDCAIIGGGPGGLIAALYLFRFKRKIVLFDAGEPRARWAPRIRNLIGFTNGISGKALLHRLKLQLSILGVETIRSKATVHRVGKNFEVKTVNGSIRAKAVILATGMQDLDPQLTNLNELRRKALLAYCPICDGFDYSDASIGLLVDSSHGLKKMRFIAKFSPHLHVITTKVFKISPIHKRIIKKLGIQIHRGKLESIKPAKGSKGITVKQRGRKPFKIRLAYVALGTKVDRSATKHINGLKRTKEGFIVVTSHQETSIRGIYAVGDCVNALSQVSVAVGHAAIAATRVHNSLGF